MARKRMVSPELLTSLVVASLPIQTRYAFIALWMYLDDAGRGKDNADLIRAHTWPLDPGYTVRKVRLDIEKLVDKSLLCRYVVDGIPYLHSPSWKEHQKINRPTDSKLPPCPNHDPEEWRAFSECSRIAHEGLTPKSVEVSSREGSSSANGPSVCEHGYSFDVAAAQCALCRGRRNGLKAVGS